MSNYKEYIPQYCSDILRLLSQAGYEAYVVGGAVRDLLLGKIPHDFDLATSATPNQVIEVCDKAGLRHVAENGLKHGTVTVISHDECVEITTFRTESGYSDNRRPDSVEFTTDIKQDVMRRDYTMNALYLDYEGNICDEVGGIDDIKAGIIRSVGDPYRRYEEDALRILRGLRFSAQLGFKLDTKTADACRECAQLLNNISAERIFTEFTGLICGEYASDVIRENFEVITTIIPELGPMRGFDQCSRYHDRDMLEHSLAVLDGISCKTGSRPVGLAYAALLHDIGKPSVFYKDSRGFGHMKRHPQAGARIVLDIADRLKFPSALRQYVHRMVLLHDTYTKPDKKYVHRFMMRFPDIVGDELFELQRADIMGHSVYGRGRLDVLDAEVKYYAELRRERAPIVVGDLEVSGEDLINAGFKPGPEFSTMLRRALRAVVEGQIPNKNESIMKFLRKM